MWWCRVYIKARKTVRHSLNMKNHYFNNRKANKNTWKFWNLLRGFLHWIFISSSSIMSPYVFIMQSLQVHNSNVRRQLMSCLGVLNFSIIYISTIKINLENLASLLLMSALTILSHLLFFFFSNFIKLSAFTKGIYIALFNEKSPTIEHISQNLSQRV